jgi:hypothetical protein
VGSAAVCRSDVEGDSTCRKDEATLRSRAHYLANFQGRESSGPVRRRMRSTSEVPTSQGPTPARSRRADPSRHRPGREVTVLARLPAESTGDSVV